MVALDASTFIVSSTSTSTTKVIIKAKHDSQQLQTANLSIPQRPVKVIIDEIKTQNVLQITTQKPKSERTTPTNSKAVEELYAIMEVVADRIEMHKNIGVQRDNWNHLLLTSVNGMTVTAATMAGLASMSGGGATLLALKLSSAVFYLAATGILVVMNKIQPSQLAEEQRNASRLFKQLHEEFKSTIALKKITSKDVKDSMEKVLALDRAYPLPLLGQMLDKFPKNVEPAVWWPKGVKYSESRSHINKFVKVAKNGWSEKLEEEMREIVGVLKKKDTADYLRLSKLVLKVSKVLSICGPLFTALAAMGTMFVGSCYGSLGVVGGIVFGAMATVVNTLEHGGQVGMVFEMYRSSAGFFRLMEESIESNLSETEVGRRANGEVFEAKVALELGRNLSELRHLASTSSSSSSKNPEVKEEFASKLF